MISMIQRGLGQGTDGFPWKDLSTDLSQAKAFTRNLRLGVELGLTLIDTAEVYGQGDSETLIGKAIEGIRDQVFIATKFSAENSSYDGVIRAAENSLKRLNIETIDLYQAHWSNLDVPFEETGRALMKLHEQGKIRYVGLSNFSVTEMKAALPFLGTGILAAAQHEYNLLERSIEKRILPFCLENKMMLLAYSPLIRGGIEKFKDRFLKLEPLCKKYSLTLSQLALNWLTCQRGIIPIPKTSSEIHLRENAAGIAVVIEPADIELISRICAPKLELIPTDQISVASASDRNVYRTLDEAIENKFNMVPSPMELSKQITAGDVLKPIKVRRSLNGSSKAPYELLDGRTRYWAWVIANQGKKLIEAIVE